jgi:hypothetical protein
MKAGGGRRRRGPITGESDTICQDLQVAHAESRKVDMPQGFVVLPRAEPRAGMNPTDRSVLPAGALCPARQGAPAVADDGPAEPPELLGSSRENSRLARGGGLPA